MIQLTSEMVTTPTGNKVQLCKPGYFISRNGANRRVIGVYIPQNLNALVYEHGLGWPMEMSTRVLLCLATSYKDGEVKTLCPMVQT